MANFANDHWYQITLKQFGLEKPLLSLATANTTNNGTSPVFMQLTNTSMPNQRWQIWHAQNDSYVLRSGNSGPWGYMVSIANRSDTAGGSSSVLDANSGNTVPTARNYAVITDNAYLWKISPWGDGSFMFTNVANGTDWHLQKEEGHGGMSLSSNVTGQQPGQRFIFNSLEKISKDAFATLQLPPSSTTSSAPTETSIDLSDSSGLSTGAIAGIGAGIGALALICIILGGLFIFRRRRNKKQALMANAAGYANMHDPKFAPGVSSPAPPYNYAAPGYPTQQYPPPPAELSQDTQRRAELGGYSHADQASKDSSSDGKSQQTSPVELEAQNNVGRNDFART